MKKTIFSLVALMFGVMGVQTLSAQTDVTSQYLTNPSFENGTEGWVVPTATDNYYNTAVKANGDDTGSPNGNPSANDGTHYLFTRKGWCGKSGMEWNVQTKSNELPAGTYYLTFDYKAADRVNDPGWHSQMQLYVGANGTEIASTPFKQLFKYYDDYTNNEYFVKGDWSKIGVYFKLESSTAVDIILKTKLYANQRADMVFDNMRLYTCDNVSEATPLDMTGSVPNAKMEAGALCWPTFAEQSNTNYSGFSGAFMMEKWTSSNGTQSLGNMDTYQELTGLPNGKYRLTAVINATQQGKGTGEESKSYVKGVSLYAGASSVAVATVNKVPEVFTVESVVTNNSLRVGLKTESCTANWIAWDNVSLTYLGVDLAIYEATFDSYYETLATLSADAIPTVLVEKINDAKTTYASRPADLAGLEAANAQMNSLIMAYNEQAAPYARIKSLISTCEDIIEFSATETADVKSPFASAVSQALADANAAISSAALQDVYNTLEGKRQDYVKMAYPISGYSFDMTFMMSDAAVTDVSLWTNGRSGSGEQYDGAPDNTYLDIYNNATDMYRTVTNLPEGIYSITAATRASADIADSYIYAQGDGEKIATTTHQVGNTGNTLDRGWDWTTINNVVVTKGNLVIGFYANAVNSKWAGADDFRLTRSYDVVSVQGALSLLKETAQTVNVLPMGIAESAALTAAINAAEEKAESTNPFELRTAIVGLEEAMKNAESWLTAYNEAKAPLVAALERFETDFNDGANGALQTMSAEAWAILLTKVQAAAEAKDATTDYSGFAAAASALTEQFDKTDYDRVVEKAQGMSSSLAVQSALAQFGDRNVILSGSSEQCAMAINVLNKAMTMAENEDVATSLWSNADFKGGTISHSVQGSGGKVNSPSGWNFAYNFDGWNDTFVNDGVFNVWAGTIRYAELSQTVGNIPNGTYKLSAYLDSDGDTQEGNSWVALYGAPKNGDVVRSCNVAGDTSKVYTAYVKVVDNELTVGVRTDARYFKIKNLSIQFVEDNAAETDKGRMYQHAFLRKDALEVDFTSFAAAQGVKVYMTQPNVIMTANEGQLTNEKNVVVNGVCEQLVLTDKSPLNISNEFEATSATYTRAMSNDWGTVILPYAVTSNEEVKYYELTEVSTGASDVMTFTLVDVLEASKPGAFKKQTGAAEVALSANNAAVAVTTDTEGVCAVDGWTMTGSYTAQTIDVTQYASYAYYYISNNQFWHATGSLTLNPFRACFKSLSASEVKNFMISLDDNQLTGIDDAHATANSLVVFGERGRLVMEAGCDVNYAVYTLNGQLVEQGALRQGESRSVAVAAGVYVVNGAKVQVK